MKAEFKVIVNFDVSESEPGQNPSEVDLAERIKDAIIEDFTSKYYLEELNIRIASAEVMIVSAQQ